MQFIHQPLIWGFLLVLLPLLIHLINMMRHRRMQWAAMDFLLVSYRKHRRWVWLKQLLLLLLRMLAIAAAVAMLARLVTQNQWSHIFGQKTTHHFVLLDDSLSMADRSGSGSAFDRGRRAVSEIAAESSLSDQQQLMTLIRYSQADRQAADDASPVVADLNAVPLTGRLESLVATENDSINVSQLAVDIQPALDLAERLMRESKDQECVLHIVSDFREADWGQPAEIRETLQRIAKRKCEVNLIHCVDNAATNLAVETLAPVGGTLAAGVPFFMKVGIRNLSATAAERVRVRTKTIFFPVAPLGIEGVPQETELPDILIDRIEPNQLVTRTFQVYFPTAGHHVIRVELPSDSLLDDNRRWCIADLDVGEPVLIVDGDSTERSAYYLESIFRPGTKARTGIDPSVQPINYLRDAQPEQLARYRSIYLLNVPPLDARTLSNLKTYVENGGGLACFLGPNSNSTFYSNWYHEGVFPLPLGLPRDFRSSTDAPAADVQFEDHPIFRTLAGQLNPFATSIRISRYVEPQSRWVPPIDSGIQVLARLGNGQPLVVERAVGAGRCVAFLTTLAPDWNNWCLEPSFIVVALQLNAYLSELQRPLIDRQVGQPLAIELDSTRFQSELTFEIPTDQPGITREVTKVAAADLATPESASGGNWLTAVLGTSAESLRRRETDYSGIYDVRLNSTENQISHRRYALNVNTRESQLKSLDAGQLRQELQPVNVAVYAADQRVTATSASQQNSWSELLLWFLLAVLLIEQWLAYRLSYHPAAIPVPGGANG